ncbi:MAG TPA: DUF6073 family protein [Thermoanaerobaculia bacterium]|nr:DUF6073 family protein [Thermoanaerobaculia bacterium]
MRKAWIAVLCLAVALAVGVSWKSAAAAGASSDQVKIAALVHDMKSLDATGLQAMQPIPIRRFEVPGPGVDVMRARLEETYSVDGVGKDTVELTGWIAVKHGEAYPVAGASAINWNTAILPTEFVEMDLSGTSAVFGQVRVTLDKGRPSYGRVGRIEIPELAAHNLQAMLVKNDAAPKQPAPKAVKPKAPPAPAQPVTPAAACQASANVTIEMPKLGIQMATKVPVLWYSLVDTIPPVGHTASIAIEPVRLISNGREVATLESGVVKFREVVRHVSLSAHALDQMATKN